MIGTLDRDIDWLPPGQYKRKPNKKSTATFTGSGKLTFAGPIAKAIEGCRIRFGIFDETLLVVRIEIDKNVPALFVSKKHQVSDRSLRKRLSPGTIFTLEFDDDLCAFVEQSRAQRDPLLYIRR